MKDGGQISFVVSKSLNRAMFVGKDLPAVGNDKRYQLWTLEGERAIADNLVAGGGDRQQFFRKGLNGITGLAVSVEDAGGAQAESGDDPGGHRAPGLTALAPGINTVGVHGQARQ
jgi:hypothetical protein